MSAAEIIEQIKALPDEEVAVVRDFLIRDDCSPVSERASFDDTMDRVFAKHDRVLRELAK